MGRCSICEDPRREAIEEAIMSGRTLRDVSKTFGVASKDGVRRHKDRHMPISLIRLGKQATDAVEEAARAMTVLARMEALYDRLTAVLDRAEEAGRDTITLAAARELRATAELIARITREIGEQPQQVLNVYTNPEVVQIVAVFQEVAGLLPPELQERVTARLAEIDGRSLQATT